jgi:hypothetical protein
MGNKKNIGTLPPAEGENFLGAILLSRYLELGV